MQKSRFKPPYTADGKTNFRHINKKAGVYIIKSKRTGDIVYIGHSKTNLYRTMYRHFQSWDDPLQRRVVYKQKNNYLVRVVFTSPARAEKLERGLIAKYKPKDNPYKIGPIDLDEADKRQVAEYLKENVRTDIPF